MSNSSFTRALLAQRGPYRTYRDRYRAYGWYPLQFCEWAPWRALKQLTREGKA